MLAVALPVGAILRLFVAEVPTSIDFAPLPENIKLL